ncbi:MAG: hypothetical protein BGO48_03965 [Mucilaginibacter sp. 44-25]|nr:MAG: hypothetical protein BGO48_03965 [Mucilaginibacter sp. 44-25]
MILRKNVLAKTGVWQVEQGQKGEHCSLLLCLRSWPFNALLIFTAMPRVFAELFSLHGKKLSSITMTLNM